MPTPQSSSPILCAHTGSQLLCWGACPQACWADGRLQIWDHGPSRKRVMQPAACNATLASLIVA